MLAASFYMLVHPNDIHRALKCLFQEPLESDNQQDARLHLHANVHIAALMLLATGD
jgi:hypothetical protein